MNVRMVGAGNAGCALAAVLSCHTRRACRSCWPRAKACHATRAWSRPAWSTCCSAIPVTRSPSCRARGAEGTEPLVSIDFNHNPASSNFDSTLIKVSGRLVKASSWYDNEWGFSNRMLDTTVALMNAK